MVGPTSVLFRSLTYYWRTHLAVVLCAMAGSATLTGALLVGDSMRGSLRDLAIRRLGPVDYALVAPHFFRETLSGDIAGDPSFKTKFHSAAPLIIAAASIQHVDTKARVNHINLYGVDDRFGEISSGYGKAGVSNADDAIILNRQLALELGADVGDDVLLRAQKKELIPTETLLGRPEKTLTSVRLTIERIISDDGVGGFTLKADKYAPRNAFIQLKTLQRVLGQGSRINTILVVADKGAADSASQQKSADLIEVLDRQDRLEDYDLHLRRDEESGYISLETDRLLIEPAVERVASDITSQSKISMMPVLTYLANTIAKETEGQQAREIPYSTVTALDPASARFLAPSHLIDAAPVPVLGSREILLNRWTADQIKANVGDRIRLEYYVTRPFGGLETRSTFFTLKGILPMRGWAADPGLTPTYKGITDAANLSDWDPPAAFRFDMRRIRPADEAYWDLYRAAPKVFVSLAAGLELWSESPDRFGRYTSIRFGSAEGSDIDKTQVRLESLLQEKLIARELGLSFLPVRTNALAAGAGSTDFSLLFIAFSFFLIAAAAMLVALVFRLGVERRASEIGLLKAAGFSCGQIMRHLLLEGALLADIGSGLGILGAMGYAWLMLAGLRSSTWWADAVQAPFLQLHITLTSILIGYVAGFLIALLSIAWSLRGLTKLSPRALLAGTVQSGRAKMGTRRGLGSVFLLAISLVLGLAAIGSAMVFDEVPTVPAFFTGGAAMLIAGLAAMSLWISRERRGVIQTGGRGAILRLGVRNATRHHGRSLTTTALIACAGFVIVAVEAFRHDAGEDALAKGGGTGGYRLMGEAVVPLPYDLKIGAGHDSLNINSKTAEQLKNATTMALRIRPGDDTSCLNLYKITRPKILGASAAMIERGGFSFTKSIAATKEETSNPWRLLNRTFDDGAVPAIGDANTIAYLLKLGLGKDFEMTDERGHVVKLRIVGMLGGSILQGELIIAENRFLDLFPSITGYGFLLIDAPTNIANALGPALENDLSDYGIDLESTIDRLNEYLAVENTYLSTFQSLGGLGLIMGTLGLAAVMFRNVVERRSELALLRALGHRQAALGWMVLSENGVLLIAGLLIGGLSALLAVAPHVAGSPGQLPWKSLGGMLILVILTGMLAGVAALRFTLKTPLLPALRSE